ncbi:response regulator [Pokkaliibacter sp. CJK22405]|uniref:response regulator n=1 Tax=Pokkaliibacter sp. CJK22405 TaxID=3384615 RepID=UPI0039846FE1
MPASPHALVSILLIEDDDIDARGVERALKKRQWTNPLLRARSATEALCLLRDGRVVSPFVVLLDLNLPGMSGIEFLKQLRHDPSLAQTIVFVLTTSRRDEDITAAYHQHVAGYIVKSCMDRDYNALLSMLESYCRVLAFPIRRSDGRPDH